MASGGGGGNVCVRPCVILIDGRKLCGPRIRNNAITIEEGALLARLMKFFLGTWALFRFETNLN